MISGSRTILGQAGIRKRPGSLFFKRLAWSDEQAPVIAEALRYAVANCAPSSARYFSIFSGNNFSDKAKATLKKAVEGSPLFHVQ